jgi:DNA polymerase-3 subunit delta'
MSGWKELIGHQWAVALLRGAIAHDRVGHAYLITGPAQLGRATLARIFAQALNCAETDVERRPCGVCRACTLIAAGRHPDVRLVEGEVSGRGKRVLKIEQIRSLQNALSLAAYEARWKVAILTDFDAANVNAANAFLKTLEEPPANVVLLLTAANADTLLETITSRCRTIGLRPLPAKMIEAALIDCGLVGTEQARLLAHLADGRPGWALQASQNPALLKERETFMEALHAALQQNRTGRFALAEKLSQRPESLPDLLRHWISWWRDLTLLAWGQLQPEAVTNLDDLPRFDELARRWSAGQILNGLRQTELALWQLERNANSRMALEKLFLEFPLPQR